MNRHKISEEIRLSYSLIFTQTPRSLEIATDLFKKNNAQVQFITIGALKALGSGRSNYPLEKKITIVIWDKTFFSSDFQIYRGHLNQLQKQMIEWRPHTAREFFNAGYADWFTWWTEKLSFYFALMGVLFGLLAASSIFLSISQTVFAALNYSMSKGIANSKGQ